MTALAFGILFVLSIFGYLWNRQAAGAIRNGGAQLHSLESFHGLHAFLLVFVPVFVLILLWLVLQGSVISALLRASLPPGVLDGLDTGAEQLVFAEIGSIAGGTIFGEPEDWKLAAAETLNGLRAQSALFLVWS